MLHRTWLYNLFGTYVNQLEDHTAFFRSDAIVMLRRSIFCTYNVAISRDFSDTEHTDFALESSMFFYKYLFCYLTNFDEIMRRECVILQATHGISKSNEPLYSF